MFLSDNDVNTWKSELRQIDEQRRTAHQDPQRYQFSKPVTWKDVKQKEAEYHPILQKFSQEGKENTQQMKETNDWRHKADLQRKNIERYLPEYNIINLEKDSAVPAKDHVESNKTRLMPAAQVDYNIITNQKLDDFHFQNAKLNVANKKKNEKKVERGPKKDYNIISNMYLKDHESKYQNDRTKVENELQQKYNKTHDFNLLVGEFYDKNKETEYQEQRQIAQQEHGRQMVEKLPPTIRNRETIIFDPTREVPDAIKKLDQKKKDAMQKYEVRYKVEDQMRERDINEQTRAEEMKMKRINDKKFTEHLDKGFDIITMDDYDRTQPRYQPKPTQTKWEKLRLTSNPIVNPQKTQVERSALTSNDLKNASASRFNDSDKRPATLDAWNTIKSGSVGDSNFARSATKYDQNFSQTKEFKTSNQRAKEPIYNLADKYNQYCVPPQKVVDDFNTRTLPQVQIADNSLKFGMTKTGGFKRTENS